ncbi:unnamed protein product [Pleuronectes platessa]|uniref:Uncharacterized protein n=1 Tax=Pleuronectes platessa TaxID=8262 RepID=A0A9N7Y7Q6_PLEPL|nr:unnamed protein product [Pleuronectes platessa]
MTDTVFSFLPSQQPAVRSSHRVEMNGNRWLSQSKQPGRKHLVLEELLHRPVTGAAATQGSVTGSQTPALISTLQTPGDNIYNKLLEKMRPTTGVQIEKVAPLARPAPESKSIPGCSTIEDPPGSGGDVWNVMEARAEDVTEENGTLQIAMEEPLTAGQKIKSNGGRRWRRSRNSSGASGGACWAFKELQMADQGDAVSQFNRRILQKKSASRD